MVTPRTELFAIKTEVEDHRAKTFGFNAHKTMYGGKRITEGEPARNELNFKFYRQATNKIVGISDEAAAFLRGFF